MKQRAFIFGALIILVVLLIGLNAASYVQKEQEPDKEYQPNRSTYNTGATGTRALYDLLAETGYNVTRLREPVKRLQYYDHSKMSTLVIVGTTRREFTQDEFTNLLNWVSSGGKLVVIDRNPPKELISTTGYWSIEVDETKDSMTEIEKSTLLGTVDPSSTTQMTSDTKAAKPTQPTVLVSEINSVQPSKFATSIKLDRYEDPEPDEDSVETRLGRTTVAPASGFSLFQIPPPPPPPKPTPEYGEGNGIGIGDAQNPENIEEADEEEDLSLRAPVVHLENDNKVLLADFPFGAGEIIFLTDPYIVSNGGISLLDNSQLAINIIGSRRGVIAFDEYHQGYGKNENQLLRYFEGTPLFAIALQLFALIGLIFFSQSRRFARALPPSEPNRLSKLEYVSAMANLQKSTKAYDLAIENIYSDFRRRVSRLIGIDNYSASREEIAKKIAERTKYDSEEIEDLMFKCEDITHGEPTKKKQVVDLISRLREVEAELGLKRNKRNS